jgi:hypothetical protein
MTRHLPVMLLLLLTLNSHSQVTNYDIGTYRLPDVRWRMLETSFGISGSSNNNKNAYNSYTQEYRNHYNNGGLNLYFYQFRNTNVLQQEVSSSFSTGYSIYNEYSNGSMSYSSRNYSPVDLSGSLVNRRYFREELFLETNLEFRNVNRSYFYQRPAQWDYEGKNIENNFSVSIPLKVGFGRIEQVQDARQAIYIFDELALVERTGTSKTDEEVIELAQHISRLRNKRYFDSRNGWMEQMESLDSLLQANNHITSQDVRYFTTLADMWGFAGSPVRRSGNRVSLAIYPGYIWEKNKNANASDNQKNTSTTNRLDIFLGPEFVHEKPLNLYWQNSFHANAYFTYYKFKNAEVGVPGFLAEVTHGIGFYPNTRTAMTFFNGFDYVSESYESSHNTMDFNKFGFRSHLNINYYFSPQLRIQASASFSTSGENSHLKYLSDVHSIETSSGRKFFSYNMSLVYKIF